MAIFCAPVLTQEEYAARSLPRALDTGVLDVTTGLISQWERGEKHPQGSSLKLLALVQKKGLEAIA